MTLQAIMVGPPFAGKFKKIQIQKPPKMPPSPTPLPLPMIWVCVVHNVA